MEIDVRMSKYSNCLETDIFFASHICGLDSWLENFEACYIVSWERKKKIKLQQFQGLLIMVYQFIVLFMYLFLFYFGILYIEFLSPEVWATHVVNQFGLNHAKSVELHLLASHRWIFWLILYEMWNLAALLFFVQPFSICLQTIYLFIFLRG